MEESREQLSCEQRVNDHMEGRLEDLREIWEKRFEDLSDEDRDYWDNQYYNYGLSFDYVVPNTFEDQEEGYFEYLISWGGPSDMFRFYVNPDFSCYKVEYRFHDWFDGAGRTLYNDDEKLLLEIWEDLREIGTVEHVFNKAMEDF